MNLVLFRYEQTENGIFGVLKNAEKGLTLQTLEHAYKEYDHPMQPNSPFSWDAKTPKGTYVCKRGLHRLASMTEEFETFEVTGVPDHTGILFHIGNYNSDSNGCILLGASRFGTMLKDSRVAFAHFLEATKDVNEFNLRIE